MTAIDHRRFRAMGTDIHVIGPLDEDLDRAVNKVRTIFGAEEQRFSRFRFDSELSDVNRRAGEPTEVSPAFGEVVGTALEAARATDGLFDPTVLPDLVAAGYDRDFSRVPHSSQAPTERPARIAGAWQDVKLSRSSLRMPPGTALDLGGIAKGWTADVAAEATDLTWLLVDAGGDMRLRGRPERPVPIAIEDPFDGERMIALLELEEGALATSTVIKRSWGPGRHHLIDPRSGLPSSTSIVQATTWAMTCVAAEVAAKSVVIGGVDRIQLQPTLAMLDDGEMRSSFEQEKAVA